MENRERFSDVRVSMTFAVKKELKEGYKPGNFCEMVQRE